MGWSAVPTHHRFGRDHNEGLLPSGPEFAQEANQRSEAQADKSKHG